MGNFSVAREETERPPGRVKRVNGACSREEHDEGMIADASLHKGKGEGGEKIRPVKNGGKPAEKAKILSRLMSVFVVNCCRH